MDLLVYFQLSLVEIYFVIFTVFIASIIRGFNGFGFSATCISGFSFILPAIEIVPIILILEVTDRYAREGRDLFVFVGVLLTFLLISSSSVIRYLPM